MGNQDYHLGQPGKTLAYAKALQYWVERSKPSIPSKPHQFMKSILELRWAMEPFTTFEDSEVLSDDTTSQDIDVFHSHQVQPRGSVSVAYSGRWPGPRVSHIVQAFLPATPLGETPLWCVAATNQPSACLPEQEEKARELPWVATLLTPPEEVVKLEEPEEVMKPEEAEKVEETGKVVGLMTLVWTQIHPSRPVLPVGLVPHSVGDEQHHHHSCSCDSHRRASLWAENQQSGSADDSVPDATWGSPVTTHRGPSMGTLK